MECNEWRNESHSSFLRAATMHCYKCRIPHVVCVVLYREVFESQHLQGPADDS